MALSAVVTKTSVRHRMPKMWTVSLTLVVSDDGTPVLTRQFSADYKQGKSIPAIAVKLQADMQTAIDEYKAEQAIFTAAALDTVATTIQSGLGV